MKKTTCTFCILSSNGYEKKYCMHLCLGKRLQFDAIKCSLGKGSCSFVFIHKHIKLGADSECRGGVQLQIETEKEGFNSNLHPPIYQLIKLLQVAQKVKNIIFSLTFLVLLQSRDYVQLITKAQSLKCMELLSN